MCVGGKDFIINTKHRYLIRTINLLFSYFRVTLRFRFSSNLNKISTVRGSLFCFYYHSHQMGRHIKQCNVYYHRSEDYRNNMWIYDLQWGAVISYVIANMYVVFNILIFRNVTSILFKEIHAQHYHRLGFQEIEVNDEWKYRKGILVPYWLII